MQMFLSIIGVAICTCLFYLYANTGEDGTVENDLDSVKKLFQLLLIVFPSLSKRMLTSMEVKYIKTYSVILYR